MKQKNIHPQCHIWLPVYSPIVVVVVWRVCRYAWALRCMLTRLSAHVSWQTQLLFSACFLLQKRNHFALPSEHVIFHIQRNNRCQKTGERRGSVLSSWVASVMPLAPVQNCVHFSATFVKRDCKSLFKLLIPEDCYFSLEICMLT